MPGRSAFRIVPFLFVGFSITFAPHIPVSGWSAAPQTAGLQAEKGAFVPKVLITKTDSFILVKKTKPDEKFDSVKMKFVFPGIEKPGAMENIYIQWETDPGKMGKLWPVNKYQRFNSKTNVLESTWSATRSFRIVDRGNGRAFRARDWREIVQIWVDGKSLVKQRTDRKPEPAPKPTTMREDQAKAAAEEMTPPKEEKAAPKPEKALPKEEKAQLKAEKAQPKPESPTAPVLPSGPGAAAPSNPPVNRLGPSSYTHGNKGAQRIVASSPGANYPNSHNAAAKLDESRVPAPEKKNEELLARLSELERKVAETQRWIYFGPLLALTLSLAFAGAVAVVSHILLSRGRRLQSPAPRETVKLASRAEGRYRSAGQQ